MFDFTSYSDLDAFCMIDYIRTENPKLFGFVRPCESVYLITLRTYLI